MNRFRAPSVGWWRFFFGYKAARVSPAWNGLVDQAVCTVLLTLVARATFAETPGVLVPDRYRGMCDASAAVAVGADQFLVADDEQNVFKLYASNEPGKARASFPWSDHLEAVVDGKELEADIEGATRLGDEIIWISSHGRNLNGKWRPSRHQLFAMRLDSSSSGLIATPVGKPYQRLATDLVQHPPLRALGLAEALGSPDEKDTGLAPKQDGFNIEGLSATADGQSLLIGFRNPLPRDQALIVPLLNPREVLREAASPKFGDPILLRLHVRFRNQEYQLGIRSLEYSARHQGYLIAAGPADSQDVFALYLWSGKAEERPRVLAATVHLLRQADFAPEAIVVYPDQPEIQLLSDDGTTKVAVRSPKECQKGEFKNGQCEQKFLLDDERKTFGSLRLLAE